MSSEFHAVCKSSFVVCKSSTNEYRLCVKLNFWSRFLCFFFIVFWSRFLCYSKAMQSLQRRDHSILLSPWSPFNGKYQFERSIGAVRCLPVSFGTVLHYLGGGGGCKADRLDYSYPHTGQRAISTHNLFINFPPAWPSLQTHLSIPSILAGQSIHFI